MNSPQLKILKLYKNIHKIFIGLACVKYFAATLNAICKQFQNLQVVYKLHIGSGVLYKE